MPSVRCGKCGRTFARFRKTGRLGCSFCYESFSLPLREILESIHGAAAHCGKRPKLTAKLELERLKAELREAVRKESFEEAARLRDRIGRLEKGGCG